MCPTDSGALWYIFLMSFAHAPADVLPVDPPGPLVVSFKGLAELEALLPARVVFLIRAQLLVFQREVALPVVRAPSVEQALSLFETCADVVGAVRASLQRALVESRAHSAALRDALAGTGKRLSSGLKPAAFRLLGRPHGTMLLDTFARSSDTARLWFDLADTYADAGLSSSLLKAMARPNYAEVARQARSLEGLSLVCALALDGEPELEEHPHATTVLRGLVERLWEFGQSYHLQCTRWMLELVQRDLSLLPQAEGLRNRLAEELSPKRIFERLAAEWRDATGHLSHPGHILRYPARRHIVALRRKAVPFILGELKRDLDKGESPWFWGPTLIDIFGEEPPYEENEAETPEGVARAWLRLAQKRGWAVDGVPSRYERMGSNVDE